jgi:hypothetical protein
VTVATSPESARRNYPRLKQQMKARSRALNRLADRHRREFERLLAEEEDILGVPAREAT